MNSIDYLIKTVPLWVEIMQHAEHELVFEAISTKKSGKPGVKYNLILEMSNCGTVNVSESEATNTLPRCCVQRHINPDASFCLYLNSTAPIKTIDDANYWWLGLGKYLNDQDYATKYKKWPRNKGLSHGKAAQVQLEMENLAEPLGWKDEVLDSLFRNKGWLSGKLMRRSKDNKGFVNLRSPCPRGCKEFHFPFRHKSCSVNSCNDDCKKDHKPILRRSCPNRGVVEQLTELEIKRRQLEEVMILELKKEGMQCCGTMNSCPLL